MMKITIDFNFNKTKKTDTGEVVIISAFTQKKRLDNEHWRKDFKQAFHQTAASKGFKGGKGESFSFQLGDGTAVWAFGLGPRKALNLEIIRKEVGKSYRALAKKFFRGILLLDGLKSENEESGEWESTITAIAESLGMASYRFDKYLDKGEAKKKAPTLKALSLSLSAPTSGRRQKRAKPQKAQKALKKAQIVTDAISLARDFINEPPNVLNSETYAKLIEKDARKLKRVRVKVLGKPQLQKEKMGLFLSVNAGSAYAPRLVHLIYTPPKVTSKTRHIALVGKGLTFDTGGYSLKSSGAMPTMKFDMAGSATVYAAFRTVAQWGVNAKVSCYLGMTDNAINSQATMPDSIVKGRSGKTVEILNTDAEGRLVLADVLSYACDQSPHVVIDAATLTGAVLVSLGHQIAGLMSNDQKLANSLLASAKKVGEYLWQLPIIPEFHEDLKGPISDLKNIGSGRWGGTCKAAAFLENFIKSGIAWAHLDVAGVAMGQSHLSYCPPKGPSGMMVRTLAHYIENGQI